MTDDKYKHGTCANGFTWTATRIRPNRWSLWIKDGKTFVTHADFESEPDQDAVDALLVLRLAMRER